MNAKQKEHPNAMKAPEITFRFSLAAVTDAALCVFAVALTVPAASHALTVYDAGAALHANATSGSIVGADGSTYIDEKGGKWQYLGASDGPANTTTTFGKSVTTGSTYMGIGGNSPGSGAPYIHVNVSGEALATNGEPVEPDEFYIHPGSPGAANHYSVVRFIVPSDGWYSAFMSAHDLSRQTENKDTSGAEVRLVANHVLQARGVVTLESYTSETAIGVLQMRRFDFQMPVRWMAAGDTIDFMVGSNNANANDATGLKAFVTREDEGAFYDSGLAMADNLAATGINPFGTASLGMWYWLCAKTGDAQPGAASAPSAAAFSAWAPGNLAKNLMILDQRGTTASLPGYFDSERGERSPYICVNDTAAHTSGAAPHELYAHPHAASWTRWPTLRFRPTRSGLYSASVVLREFERNFGDTSDGVEAFLLVAENVVTSAVIAVKEWNATAHFTFDARLVAANEPIDIVLSPRSQHSFDGTTISAIFRRESEVYDAGRSMVSLDWANATWPTHPFADALGGGATWDIGKRPTTQGTFTTMPYAFKRVVNGVDYFGFGMNSTDGGLPRVMLPVNGVANLYSSTDDPIYRVAPNEIWAHPNNSGDKCAVVRAIAPADGIYHARAYARDLSSANDGIRFSLAVGDAVPATARISLEMSGYPSEAAFDGDRLWLKAGESADAVVNPYATHNNDATGLGVCYVKENDTTPSVVNVDFAAAGSGRFSSYAGRSREGWSDWTRWNALRPGGAATAEAKDFFEADGATRHNVSVSLTHDSGEAIASGSASSGDSLCDAYIASANESDTYTFTISNLTKNAPYTLYLYSAKGSATGNATFVVNGMTKGVEETWHFADDTKTLTRFEVSSNGVISGVFAAKDANGGAFNGLTLVGHFPEYKASALVFVVR